MRLAERAAPTHSRFMRRSLLASLCLLCLGLASCASDDQDRSPWHQYLHDHGLE